MSETFRIRSSGPTAGAVMEYINRSMAAEHGGEFVRMDVTGTKPGEGLAVRYTYPDGCWFEVFGSAEIDNEQRTSPVRYFCHFCNASHDSGARCPRQ